MTRSVRRPIRRPIAHSVVDLLTHQVHAERMRVTVRSVWCIWAIPVVFTAVTYGRLAPADLYRVTHSGIAAGLGRAVLFINFPLALVAVALLAVTYDSLTLHHKKPLAVVSFVLCAAVVVPGVIDQDKLDARPINAVATLGVALALAMTWSSPWPGVQIPRRGLALGAGLAAVALPWIFASAGFFLPRGLFMSSELVHEPGESTLVPAVHLGDHHGLGSMMLIATALALWSAPRLLPRTRGQRVAQAYLALMLCYGIANAMQDFWGEQIANRGWSHWYMPDATSPGATAMWGLIIVGTIAAYRMPRRPPSAS